MANGSSGMKQMMAACMMKSDPSRSSAEHREQAAQGRGASSCCKDLGHNIADCSAIMQQMMVFCMSAMSQKVPPPAHRAEADD
jgi:hypothetical protein